VSRRAKPLTLILGAMPSEVAAIDAALVAGAHRELEGYPYQRGKALASRTRP
jgi:hypothetical protein